MASRNKISGMTQVAGVALVSVLALPGCATGPKHYEIKATADPVVNRDVSGRPLSVVVHIYQLKDAGEFSKLTFDMLASGRPLSDLLGKDLLEMKEVVLIPGDKHVGTDKVHQDAKHVGLVAFFRQPDQHYWRMLADADKVRGGGLNFRVRDCYLTLDLPKPSLIPGQPANPPAVCVGNDARATSAAAASLEATAARQGTAGGAKRSGMLDTGRQVVESILTKKP